MSTPSSNDRHMTDEIERRRVLFEQTWGEPTAPTIEQLLDEVPETKQGELLRELLYVEFEFTQRKAAKLLLEQYLSRFPEHESIVREVAAAVGQYTVFSRRNIAGYTLLGELGRGGMGVVYKAKSDLLNTFVAFKMVNQRMIDNPESFRRFTRELEMIGRLRHPNIVEAKHAGVTDDGSPFLVMELVEGVTLSQWGSERRTVDGSPQTTDSRQSPAVSRPSSVACTTTACKIIRDAARGLQAIHEAGLVHRDIKPGNIMLLPDGRVKILDLGLAKLREHIAEHPQEYEVQTRQGHFIGTPGYMAPEQQHSATSVDIRADIYSLGCTFFFLLYGHSPSESPANELPASLPRKLRTILDRMLAANPASRFQEPREVADALEAFLASPKKSYRVAIIAAVIAAVLIGIFLGWPPPVTPEDVQKAVELRYQGDVERAREELQKLEDILRATSFSGSDGILAKVLAALGDSYFFEGHASEMITKNKVEQMTDWYEEALELIERNENADVLRTKIRCHLAIINNDVDRIPVDVENQSLYIDFARAVTAAGEQPLWNFVTQFELSTESELMTREAMDLRLFALERLIHHYEKTDREKLAEALRLLDNILLSPPLDAYSSVYLSRFFDLAIRTSDPTNYNQIAKYLRLSRRSSLPTGSTWVLIYLSPWSDEDNFVIYSPTSRQETQRFKLTCNRDAVKKANEKIGNEELLTLDTDLVKFIRNDIESGIPITLSWDDTACRPRRHAFSNNDWPFGKTITVDEIAGKKRKENKGTLL